jgi:hypothetical protein
MVDRRARDILSEQLRHLVSGQITNDEFLYRTPTRTQDAGFWAVEDQAYLCYSDLYTHKLTESHALTKSGRQSISRSILFLHSDLEYQWPKHPCEGFTRLILGLISLDRIPEYFDEKWKAQGGL